MAQRNQALFEHRSDAYRVLFLAAFTHPKKALIALASLAILHSVHIGIAAARAAMAGFAPSLILEKLNRRNLIRARPWKRGDDV
jgi:hypothetical protein